MSETADDFYVINTLLNDWETKKWYEVSKETFTFFKITNSWQILDIRLDKKINYLWLLSWQNLSKNWTKNLSFLKSFSVLWF